MTPVTPTPRPNERLVVFAENQPEYKPLPAYRDQTGEGCVTTEWVLTPEELILLNAGGRIRLQVLTFDQPLQPIKLDCVPEPTRIAASASNAADPTIAASGLDNPRYSSSQDGTEAWLAHCRGGFPKIED